MADLLGGPKITYWIDDCQCLNGFLRGDSCVPTRLHMYRVKACSKTQALNWWQCDVIGLPPLSKANTVDNSACRPLSTASQEGESVDSIVANQYETRQAIVFG